MKKIFLTLIFCAAVYFSAQAQLTLTHVQQVDSLQACQQDTFAVNIQNGAICAATDTLKITLAFPFGIEPGGFHAVNTGTLTVVFVADSTAIFTVTGLSGNSVTLTYSVIPRCRAFSATTRTGLFNTVTARLNTAAAVSLDTPPYALTTPVLVFDQAQSRHLRDSAAPFNLPFDRFYVFKNNSSVSFTGDIFFTDTVSFRETSALRIDTAFIIHPLTASVTTAIVTDSAVCIHASISNLASGDSIVIQETVKLVSCATEISKSIAVMISKFGCSGDSLLCTISTSFQTWATLSGKPVISFDQMDLSETLGQLDYLCPATEEKRIFRVINVGDAMADSVHLGLGRAGETNISYFDKRSVEVYKRISGAKTPVPFIVREQHYAASTYIPFDSLFPINAYRFSTVEGLLPGDTLFMSFIEKKACIDPAKYIFNDATNMNQISITATLGHPCFASSSNLDHSSRSVWSKRFQFFSFGQLFENFTPAMDDGEQAWFKVDTKTPLMMNITFPIEELFMDPNKAKFQVELDITQGLGLVQDSIYLFSTVNGVDIILRPDNIQTVLNDGINNANGSTIIATFSFPSTFFGTNVGGVQFLWGARWRKTNAYHNFFSRMAVRFKLGSDCKFSPPNGVSGVTEKTFLIYDTTCTPQCKIPLAKVGSQINLHCPGCKIPGWNMSGATIERENVGWKDNNNDNHPDTVPVVRADKSRANLHRAMIGDTIRIDVSGSTSDGEGLLRFSNIGFAYRYARFVVRGRLMQDMEFLGAVGGAYTSGLGGAAAAFNIPASAGRLDASDFFIDISIDTLRNYLTGGTTLRDSIWLNDAIVLHPKFRIKNNIKYDGKYFNTEDLVTFIYMSGVPFGTTALAEAPPGGGPALDTLSGSERAKFFYWCTGGEGRVTAVGSSFNYTQQAIAFEGFLGITRQDFCLKKFQAQLLLDAGADILRDAPFYTGTSNQAALNAFPFEVRDFMLLDSMSAVIPSGYELARVDIRSLNLMLDTVSNLTRFEGCHDLFSGPPFFYPLSDARVQDSTVTIYPHRFYTYLTTGFDTLCKRLLLDRGDETKRVQVEWILRMKDCKTTPLAVDISNSYPLTSYLSNFPQKAGRDTVIRKNMPLNSVLRKPAPNFTTKAFPDNTDLINSTALSWTVTMHSDTAGGRTEDNGFAANSFLYVVSPSGAVTVSSVTFTRHDGAVITPTLTTIAGRPLYGVGDIGLGGSITATINATFNCATVQTTDSVLFITGWNCDGYPSSLHPDSVCFADTTVVHITPQPAGLSPTLTLQPQTNFCDSLHYTLALDATGLGNVNHVTAQLILPAGNLLNYIPGSVLSYPSNTVAFEPDSLTWRFDTIPAIRDNFNFDFGALTLNFTLAKSCAYAGEDVTVKLNAETFCGKPIEILLNKGAAMLGAGGGVSRDTLSVNALQCSKDSIRFNVDVQNSDGKTNFINDIQLIVPPAYAFAASGNNNLTITLPVASHDSSITVPIHRVNNFCTGSADTVQLRIINNATVFCTDACNLQVPGDSLKCIFIYPATTLFAGNDTTICPGSSVTLTATGTPAGGAFLWSSGDTTASITVSPTVNTAYSVTYTNGLCVVSDTVRVNVLSSSLAVNFSFDPFDNCEDQTIPFTNTSTGAASLSWNFGDPISGADNVSTLTNPTHIFIHPGYYQVTLTGTGACGATDTASQIIYILPSTSTYNPNCCVKNYSYDFIDVLITAAASPIASPIHWSSNRTIKGTLTVQSGAGLIVDPGVTVGFGPQGKVIVEPGATLTLDGATFTSIDFSSVCAAGARVMWQGVEVWGIASNSAAAAQGKIVMQNNAKIEDAYIGVMLGKSLLNWDALAQRFTGNGHVSSEGGGIIRATNSTFNRNAQGVHFWEYPAINFSLIQNNSFTSKTSGVNTAVLDPYFNNNNTPYYNTQYLVFHNPFIGISTETFFGLPRNYIGMYGIKNVLLFDNNFDFVTWGIWSVDSKFNVVKNATGHTFQNMQGGILCLNTLSPIYGNTFSFNTFIEVNRSIELAGTRFDNVKTNEFRLVSGVIGGLSFSIPTGVQVKNSSNLTIVDNVFTRLKKGILFDNSAATTSSLIGFSAKGNIFTNCSTSVETNNANKFLTIRCNTHINSSAANYVVNWNNTGTLGQQGTYAPPPADLAKIKEKKPAGNRFNPGVTLFKEIKTAISYKYFAHSSPPDRIPVGIGFTAGNINSGSVPSTSFLNSCRPLIPPTCIPCNQQAIAEARTQIAALQTEFNAVLASLDKGQTLALLAAIAGNTSNGNLKTVLLNHFPLSDTVLLAFMTRNNVPNGHLKDVFVANSPVSDAVLAPLEAKQQTLTSDGTVTHIREAQTVNEGVRTLTAIARDIIAVERDRQLSLNNVIAHFANADSMQSALDLLEQETNAEAKQTLVAEYIQEGNFAAALNKLSALPTHTVEDAAFVNLYSLYVDLFSTGKTLWDMSVAQAQSVRTIANLCPASLATTNAKAVLQLVFGETVPDCASNFRLQSPQNNATPYSKPEVLQRSFLGDNIPNPFNSTTVIPYYLPQENKNAALKITDMAGRTVKFINFTSATGQVELSVSDFESGIYFYSMEVEGQTVQTKKMVVIK